MFGCACPPSTALTVIPANDCGENIGQIQKVIVQRVQPTASPTIADIEDASVLATWTALKALNTAAKVIISPYTEEVVIPRGAPITEGGDDNTTLNGNAIVMGASAIQATGIFRALKSAVLRALKALNCEATTGLSFGFINDSGQIIGRSTGAATTDFRLFPVVSFFIGDPGAEGLNTHDKAPFQFGLRYGWRDYIKFVTPTDFDALVDL